MLNAKYCSRDSFIHKLDPRTKILGFVIFIFLVVLTPPTNNVQFLLFFLLLLTLIIASKISIIHFIKNVSAIFPFIILVSVFIPFFKQGEILYSFMKLTITYEGLIILKNVLIKSFLSILILTLLSATTKFYDILKAMEKLYFPKIVIVILLIMYRYLFLLLDEKSQLERAMLSRCFTKRNLLKIKVLCNITGSLFIRTYERGERIYIAMCSRLFDGNINIINKLRIKPIDIYFSIFLFTALLSIKIFVK